VPRRLADALGDETSPEIVAALVYGFAGVALQAGMSYFGDDELAERLAGIRELMLGSGT
jgi:hypothetical protein